jgi:hypothetical protein
MKRYVCKNDINFMGKKLASVGDIVEEGSTLTSDDETITLKLDNIFLEKSTNLFEIISDINIEIKEVENDEDFVKDWIIQMKVNTSRRKLRLIEDFLRANIDKML